jgi:hypothetical protein
MRTTAVTTSTKASAGVSYVIARNKKPHYIGETLLLPAAMKMCEITHSEIYGKALKTIPVCSNMVLCHIESVSEDNKEQLLTRTKCSSKFALQITKSACYRISSAACIFQILFQRKHRRRVHVLSATFREMQRE